jgi:hypothetical protein
VKEKRVGVARKGVTKVGRGRGKEIGREEEQKREREGRKN